MSVWLHQWHPEQNYLRKYIRKIQKDEKFSELKYMNIILCLSYLYIGMEKFCENQVLIHFDKLQEILITFINMKNLHIYINSNLNKKN